MTLEDKSEKEKRVSIHEPKFEQVASGVKRIERRVDEISDRLADHYDLLRDIQESVSHENGPDLYDLFDGDEHYH